MNEGEYHRYRVVGDRYKGYETFVRVNKVIVAHDSREANDIAFKRLIIPSKIRDLGTVTEQATLI